MSGYSQAFVYLGFALYVYAVIADKEDRSDKVETLESPKVSFWDPGEILGLPFGPFLRPVKNPFSFIAALSGVALVIIAFYI